MKTYSSTTEGGSADEKKIWFGYKCHIVCDTNYELPISWSVTKASVSDAPEAHNLLEKISQNHPEILKRCAHFAADKGYDDTKLITKLKREYKVAPIIGIRNGWQGDRTRTLGNRGNITYNHKGTIRCYCPCTGEEREMAYGVFEKGRESLKYVCPMKAYGVDCKGRAVCPIRHSVRVNLRTNERIFTPTARSSYKWKGLYKKRTAIERINSRLDEPFGFEKHYIRGVKKMRFRCGLAFCIMLAMALGRLRQKQPEMIRSLVRTKAA